MIVLYIFKRSTQPTVDPEYNHINLHLFRLTKTSNNQTTVISEPAFRAFVDSTQ